MQTWRAYCKREGETISTPAAFGLKSLGRERNPVIPTKEEEEEEEEESEDKEGEGALK